METKVQPVILINPPPADGRCDGCRRHVSELPTFTGPFEGAKLIKDFRGYEDCISAYWSCMDCLPLSDKDFYAQWK